MPSGYKTSDVPSRYQPLYGFLAGCDGDEIMLTYEEVDAILGVPLPPSALLVSSWWVSTQHGQVRAWRALGWRARASSANQCVRFIRDVEQEEKMPSKYDCLGDYLAAIGAATIILTFAEVEAVVGPLPKSAHSVAGWWGATAAGRYENAHALHWWRAGYVADHLDFIAETVTFRRFAQP